MRFTILLPVFLLALSACSSAPTSISEQNKNPLTASRYGDELADSMANFIIGNDPILEDASARKFIESEINRGKDIAAEARQRQKKGWMGGLTNIKAFTEGYVLYLPDSLYFSSDFHSTPGPSVHVYLTTVVDPRDVTFPDETSLDLGPLQAAYGPQQYAVPSQKEPEKLRAVVLYDTRLHLIYGFAQIAKIGS